MFSILIIGNVWPEPNSSAAGSRMLQLLELFSLQNWKTTFASTASESQHMHNIEELGISKISIEINNASFDNFILKLNPDIVIFDRFMTEEQFGWRISKHLPNALKILNTEDLHSLRKTREQAFKLGKEFQYKDLIKNDITKREIASIYRSDLSLIISDFEIKLLRNFFKIKKSQLLYLPFLFHPITPELQENWPNYNQRNHFITIGNFRHEPNWDSVLYLKETIWPLIKKQLPQAELYIYGAYPPPKATQLHNPNQGFHIKGWTNNSKEVMQQAKVCLAPLRFGAGIKGKLAEAMLCGTPSITTNIGAEGMLNKKNKWNGQIANDPYEFANAAVKLYTNVELWKQSQQYGVEIINTRFKKEQYNDLLIKRIKKLKSNIEKHRSKNFMGSLLQYHTLRSTEFMSRWIEEKNKP